MRIIGGSAGGRTLKAPPGRGTRPTADKVRQAVFNILCARWQAPARVLDLYAGSGAMGLEALSRGAGEAVFVESDRRACEVVQKNAAALGLAAHSRVVEARALDWLARAEQRFGWIFLDPPYAGSAAEVDRVVALIERRRLLDDAGVIVAEHDAHGEPAGRHGALALTDRRHYGQTQVSFFTEEKA